MGYCQIQAFQMRRVLPIDQKSRQSTCLFVECFLNSNRGRIVEAIFGQEGLSEVRIRYVRIVCVQLVI